MIPEDKHQKLKRLEQLAANGYDQNRQAEMRNGLAWAVKEIRELDRVCQFQRKQNALLSETIKQMSPELFGKDKNDGCQNENP